MAITAQMVKELRESTGAGMMDAKKALTETGGDMEAAIDWLRTKGLAKAAKKADRVAAEGLVGVAVSDGRGVAVEINSETDFVAKNADFQALVAEVTKVALQTGKDVEVLKATHLNGKPVEQVLSEAIARIGENMTLRRMHVLEGDTVVSYVHNAAADGMGKIGVLVAIDSSGDKATLLALGKQIAMHIAAANPSYLNAEEIPEDELNKEKDAIKEEVAASGKPAEHAEKIIEGKLTKWYEEVCLINQPFVKDPNQTIEQLRQALVGKLGENIVVRRFTRMEVGGLG